MRRRGAKIRAFSPAYTVQAPPTLRDELKRPAHPCVNCEAETDLEDLFCPWCWEKRLARMPVDRALFIDVLDREWKDGGSVGSVARELGIGRRTAWRWIHEMERERLCREAPTETADKRENAGLSGTADEG